MKICVFGTRGFPLIQGGVEKHCECLYTAMPTDSEIIVFRRKPYVVNTPTYPNIRFIDLPSTRIKGFEAAFHSFLCTIYCLFLRPNIVHIHNIGNTLYAPLLRMVGIRVVLTYHSPNYEHAKWGKVAKAILRFSEKIALSCSNAIVFVNQFQMTKYDEKVKKKSFYIPNGIEQPIKTDNIDFLNSIKVVPNRYILAVGRITPEKGFDCLIRAFNRLPESDMRLVIAGGVETESRYFNDLKNLCKYPDRVIWTGAIHTERLAQLYTNTSLFVLSSYNEGFPMVLLEAMSYGDNIVVSDIPACKAVNLDNDCFFRCGDDKDLSIKIQHKLSNSDTQKCTYNLLDYKWEKVAASTYNTYIFASKSR